MRQSLLASSSITQFRNSDFDCNVLCVGLARLVEVLRGILGPWGQLHQRSDLPEAASPVDTAHSIIPYRCIP